MSSGLSKHYSYTNHERRLATKVVHLEEALELANELLKKHGCMGVLPNESVYFKKAKKFYSKVNKILANS